MIRKRMPCLLLSCIAAFLCPWPSSAQQPASPFKGHVIIPKSSVVDPADAGEKAHTNIRIFAPPNAMNFGAAATVPAELPPFPGFFFETPASLGCIYNLVSHPIPGCNPNLTTENPNIGKGSNTIALVDAFDDPTAAADLATFSAQFGLPPANLQIVYATGVNPGPDPTGGWELEESLDLQMAHAMAPNATLILVVAPGQTKAELYQAAAVAGKMVANSGGEVSMSWGFPEYASEASDDHFFSVPRVVYFAAAGDGPGVLYPSASPNVVSAGGTSISRDPNSGAFLLEDTWQDAGGGPSQVEPRPSFQDAVPFVVGASRGTPDLSFDANPTTGVWLFDSNPVLGTGWFVVGGTSVSSPALAGIVNAAGSFLTSSPAENQEIYTHPFNGFRDIFYGNCGFNAGTFASFGYDLCTGVGVTKGLRNK
jgi:kumamolisin